MDVPIAGQCAPGFEPVRDAFLGNFLERGEVGAGVCVVVHGQVVVDLVGGWTDLERTRPWASDTLVNLYSVGKALVATLLLQQVDAGVVSLDDPIASVWPEFTVGGKRAATIRQALCHQAGVPAIARRVSNDDLWHWERMTAALAATPAWFEPGSRHVYHTNTYGHLIGELVHRTSGMLPGDRLRAVAAPLGAELFVGVAENDLHRCADVIWAPASPMEPPSPDALDTLEGDAAMVARSYFNPPGYSSHGVVNTTEWRRAQVPSTNTHGTAGGIARFYAGLIDPGQVLSTDLLREATRVQSSGPCPVLGEDVEFGLGFVPSNERRPLGPNPGAFGHFGTGGALGFADPASGVAFGYAMNHVIPRWQSTRNRALITAVFGAL